MSRLAPAPLIAIVDDDAAQRDALADLIEVIGLRARAFDSSESFLAAHVPGLFGCLITDLNLLGESGLQLRRRLQVLDPSLPVIIISAQADPSAGAWALRHGALAYLAKPVNDQVLLRHLNSALERAARA
jgi:FixJ family two-component response regulator